MMDWRDEHWRDLAATDNFFRELRAEFWGCLNDGWYETSDAMVVQRLRGQRDVFEAIERVLGARRED